MMKPTSKELAVAKAALTPPEGTYGQRGSKSNKITPAKRVLLLLQFQLLGLHPSRPERKSLHPLQRLQVPLLSKILLEVIRDRERLPRSKSPLSIWTSSPTIGSRRRSQTRGRGTSSMLWSSLASRFRRANCRVMNSGFPSGSHHSCVATTTPS